MIGSCARSTGVVSVINEGEGVRFAKLATIIRRIIRQEMRGETGSVVGSAVSCVGVDGAEDFRDDKAGGKRGKGAALDTAFRLREHVAVEVFATAPKGSGVFVAQIAWR